MYIAETTAKERLTIDHATSGIFGNLERAHRMLYRLWEDNFGDAEQKDISAYDAESLGDLIYTIDDIIFNAVLEYSLLTCNKNAPGVEPHLKGAGYAVQAMRVHDLNDAIFDRERRMKPKQRDEVCTKRGELLKLPNEQAIPALEALLKELEGGV